MSSQRTTSTPEPGQQPTHILLTGCYRSGTSLADKLLHAHPQIALASQPFPVLFFHVKAAFDRSIRLQRRYPLDHLFRNRAYRPAQFHEFLDRFTLTELDIDQIFDGLAQYGEGLWTPEILACRQHVSSGSFLDVYKQLATQAATLLGKGHARVHGNKEILCEEYVPYLIGRGVKACIVLRDPRDLIASLNYRARDNLTGARRPILYSLRIWRKSAAILLACRAHPNFTWLRYEDLVRKPHHELSSVTNLLGVDDPTREQMESELVDQYGRTWAGNSSFGELHGISEAAVGRFQTILPEAVTAFIEACCFAEMKTLGYRCECLQQFEPEALRGFQEPFPVRHRSFSTDYSRRPEHVREELERYRKLSGDRELGEAEKRAWFLYPETWRALRQALHDAAGD